MDNPNRVTRGVPLPYMDNWPTVLLTVALNVALSLAVRFGQAELTRGDIILHGAVLGLVTSIQQGQINQLLLALALRWKRAICPHLTHRHIGWIRACLKIPAM